MLGWTFTTLPDRHALTVPLLVVLHLLIGVATAGVNISTTTIRMKMAPRAQATSYLTAATLAASIGAGTSPLLGGLFADFFSVRHLQVAFEWVSPARTVEFPAVFLTGFDFLFAVAFLMGLVTLRVLATIREEGEVDQQVVMDTLMAQTRDNLRVLNTVPGLAMASRVPEATVRFVPRFAGLDVAAGVTAYQVACVDSRSGVGSDAGPPGRAQRFEDGEPRSAGGGAAGRRSERARSWTGRRRHQRCGARGSGFGHGAGPGPPARPLQRCWRDWPRPTWTRPTPCGARDTASSMRPRTWDRTSA